ncbi:hypothetical protein LGR54_25015 [Ancylobacter sp. Lp-2]|uniref:hypothetical protein n=1 Tax=Ancylobacter sp. Lp-2 TaxID=2881339 RepID=UPI001E64D8A9|nr:hypothetical protein [Ancylobacter sp. Lp-2]MCB4771875.1 hypothetical protein [Ancylobacter sp. Lp-2]
MAKKIALIAGASRGFGRIWAEAALARGDKVDQRDVRAELDTNAFGMLRLIQAPLPCLREQRSGHILCDLLR